MKILKNNWGDYGATYSVWDAEWSSNEVFEEYCSDLSDSLDGENDFDDSDDLNYDYSEDRGFMMNTLTELKIY